jgi:SAM-dependent methyltransferase
MSTVMEQDRYSLGHTGEEYDRLRAQARVWEAATGRLLDQVGLAAGARCLDAGCGPGETMRVLAQRVGPAGRVHGIDTDAALGAMALATLHDAGHRQCTFGAFDLTTAEPVPEGPFDLVHARLLLFHLPDRVAVLARLWDAVAPGGHLLVQDYDLHGAGTIPATASAQELLLVLIDAFTAAGCDVRAGARLPQLFAEAGIGRPDGTDVAGRLEPLARGRSILESTLHSVLPAAIAHGVTSAARAAAILEALAVDADRFGDRGLVWPLMMGAWKRKAGGGR